MVSHYPDYFCSFTHCNYLLLVWCWGWDGAGDLEGPDVDPIWERMPNKSTRADSVVVRHDRSILL